MAVEHERPGAGRGTLGQDSESFDERPAQPDEGGVSDSNVTNE